MKRSVGILIAATVLAGCRSSAPSFDPFAAYGPRRVPPPATGSYGRPDSYYQPPATSQPPAAAPFSSPPGARPLPATPPPSLGTEPPGTTNLIPPPVAPSNWKPSDSDQSVDLAAYSDPSLAATDEPAEDESTLNLPKNDRLIWNRPDKAFEQEVRTASATEPVSPSPHGSTRQPIGSFAPQLDTDVTPDAAGAQDRSAPGTTPAPHPFTPHGPLREITQLPTPTYLPNNFRPLAVRRSRPNPTNPVAPGSAVYTVAPASADDCLCLPSADAIGSGVVTAPGSYVPQFSTMQGATANSVIRDGSRGPATARTPAVENWKSR